MMRLQAWRIRALIVGGCVALAAAGASIAPFVWNWEEGMDLHLLFRLRGARPAPQNVVLVPIDARAARSLFMPASADDFERCRDVRINQPLPGHRNPDPPEILTRWPRCLHARVLDALAPAQPDAVAMDISFRPRSDPSGVYAEQDRALAEAMRRLGKVVLVRKIKSDQYADERAEPIASAIEAAALAVAPFLLVGDQLQRADKFCTFKEDDGWSGPCLPAVAYQAASLEIYPELRKILGAAASKNADLMPARGDTLLADGALQAPVRLIRHLAMSDPQTGERVRALLAADDSAPAGAHPRVRGLAEIYLGPGLRYFNFYGPPGRQFQTLRYEALAAGPAAALPAPGSLRGKVVFIGFAEYENPEPIEHFTTPFTTPKSIKLSGVELAATAYANLQDGSAVQPAAWWLRALIALALAVSCTLAWVALSPWRALALCAAVMLAYFGLTYEMFASHALWLPLVVPLGFVVPTAMGAGFASWLLELKRQRDRSSEVMHQMLPKRVADLILSNNKKLTELRESVHGACVFTDAKGFTALGESLPPERMAQVMQEYFQSLFLVVKEIGGEPSDTAGDAMLAVWADLAPDASLRRRACSAALKIAEAVERFNRTRARGEALPTRIGVDYGWMSRGMLGSPFHIEYRHMGDATNTAGRLQKLNEKLKTRLLVSEAVIQGLDGEDGFLVRDVGYFKLRGKKRPTHAYELIAERAHAVREQLDLCASFAAALAAYRADRRDEARERFEALHREHQGDGPSAYYAKLCARGRFLGRRPIAGR
jgi:adenylate cyclase